MLYYIYIISAKTNRSFNRRHATISTFGVRHRKLKRAFNKWYEEQLYWYHLAKDDQSNSCSSIKRFMDSPSCLTSGSLKISSLF